MTQLKEGDEEEAVRDGWRGDFCPSMEIEKECNNGLVNIDTVSVTDNISMLQLDDDSE